MPADNFDDVAVLDKPGTNADQAADKGTNKPGQDGGDKGAGAGEGTGKPAGVVLQNEEAVELATMLADAGYTKSNIQELLASPRIVNQLSNLVENDPAEFFRYIERQNPQAAAKLLNKLTDVFIDRYNEGGDDSEGSGGKTEKEPAWARTLRENVENMQRQNEAARQQALYNYRKQQYHTEVDKLIGNVKDLSKKDQRSVKALLNESIGSDSNALTRINNGSFVDIPKHLKRVLDEFTDEKVTTTGKEEEARDKVKKNAGKEIADAAGAGAGGDNVNFADSWDETEKAFASALTKAGKKK